MKKTYKVTWISLASLLGVIIVVVLLALYLVLTPKRLTSLVNKYAEDYVTCDVNVGKVDLTLFKTFPDAGIEINDLLLMNPTQGWTSDTLAYIDECIVSVNLRKLLFGDEIIVNTCMLNGGFVNAFFDTEGNTNLDIMPPSEAEEVEPEVEEAESSYAINIDKVKINNLRLNYTDLAENTVATINGLSLLAKASIIDDIIDGDIDLNISDLKASIADDSTAMDASVKDFAFNGIVKMEGDNINADANLASDDINFLMTGSDNITAFLDNLDFKYKGDINNYEFIKGILNMTANGTTLFMDDEKYVDSASINLEIPLEFDLNEIHAKFDKSQISYNDIEIEFIGEAIIRDEITLNMDFHTNAMIINNIIRLIPNRLRNALLSGIKINGELILNSHIEGTYDDEHMPVIDADVMLKDGYFEMPEELPYPIHNLNTTLHANVDLNGKSDLDLHSLSLKMNNTVVAANGTVNDFMDKMDCDLSVKTDLYFDDVKSFFPDELLAKGAIKADVNVKGTVDQLSELDLMNTKLDGNLQCRNLDIVYADTINIKSSDLKVDFMLPNPNKTMNNGLAQVKLKGADLDANITGMMTAALKDFNIDAQVSNVLDENDNTAAIADFTFSRVDFTMDDMVLHSNYGGGSAFMLPSCNDGNISYAAVYNSDSLVFGMGDEMYFATEALAVDLSADYDEKEEDFILQWKPSVTLALSNAAFEMSDLSETVVIPEINLTYGEPGLHIDNSQITLGNSDFELEGDLTNLYEHFKNGDLLIGEFNFTSNYTDVNQLMDIFNGMGTEEETTAAADSTAVEDDPFMVPMGVEVILHTDIRNALAGEMEIRNVGGDLTIKDGVLVLQEMGFTSDAAKMQLTALYKSKRRNHLYAGFDFHLLDIDIAEMIRIIPDLDTIVPMLKEFAGKAEFHFAAETNLKSDYTPKYSTLKGACSIEGADLVVLDSETFNTIKKLLLFKNTTENKIDSLSVQFTVFKNEIDVYPFAVTLDKYSAMLYGRHNLDMSYDYHISVLEPPVLNRLGMEIMGPDFDNMKFKVRKSKHRNIFVPEKRDYKEEKIIELKKIISNSLKANVK